MGKSEKWRSYLVGNDPTETATFEDIISHQPLAMISEPSHVANNGCLTAAADAQLWLDPDPVVALER